MLTKCFGALGQGGLLQSRPIGGVLSNEVRGDLWSWCEEACVQCLVYYGQGSIAKGAMQESYAIGDGGVWVVRKAGMRAAIFCAA